MFGSATSINKITACRHMQQKYMVKEGKNKKEKKDEFPCKTKRKA